MAGVQDIIEAGFDLVFYSQNDADGFPLGGTGIAVAGDSNGSPALRLHGAQSVDPSLSESERVTTLGDDRRMVSFMFEGADNPQSVLEVATKNLVAAGCFAQVTPRTQAGIYQLPMGVNNEFASIALLFQRQAKSWTDGFTGVKKRSGIYLPAAELEWLGAAYNQRSNTDAQRYAVVASNADRHLWGETFSIGNDTVENAPMISLSMDNLVHQHAFRGDGVKTVFNLQYTPLTPLTHATLTNEGIIQANPGAYAIAAKVITFVAAPANNARIIVTYEFARSELG